MDENALTKIEEALSRYPEYVHRGGMPWYVEQLANCVAELRRKEGNTEKAVEALRVVHETRALQNHLANGSNPEQG